MILTFLLGMIAGAVGITMFGNWLGKTEWFKTHIGVKADDECSERDPGDMDRPV